MQTEQIPTLKQLAKQLERLYREKDEYLIRANDLKTQLANLRLLGDTDTDQYTSLVDEYQVTLSWLNGLQFDINESQAVLENSIDALKW